MWWDVAQNNKVKKPIHFVSIEMGINVTKYTKTKYRRKLPLSGD